MQIWWNISDNETVNVTDIYPLTFAEIYTYYAKRMFNEGDSLVNKTESNIKACEEAAFERCINFIVEMIEKYGNTIIIEDNNINKAGAVDESVA